MSIRGRLTFWYSAVMVVVLVTGAIVGAVVQSRVSLQRLDDDLTRTMATLVGVMHTEFGEGMVRAIWMGVLIALLIAAAGGWLTARQTLRPLSEMAAQASGIDAHDPTGRLSAPHPGDELGRLAAAFSGTYGVSVVPAFTKRPVETYSVSIMFACDPARASDLVKALFAVVEDFQTRGPSASQVADAQAALRRDLEIDSRQNSSMLNTLAFAYQYDEPVPDAATLRQLYDQLSVPLLRDAANTYVNVKRYVKVVLMPEGNTP